MTQAVSVVIYGCAINKLAQSSWWQQNEWARGKKMVDKAGKKSENLVEKTDSAKSTEQIINGIRWRQRIHKFTLY